MMQNQILTTEELLNELNASLPSLSSSRTFKSPNSYLTSSSFPGLWTTYNTISADTSSMPKTYRKHKSCSRKHFAKYSSDPDSSDASQDNLETSGPLTSSCSSNHHSSGKKFTSSSSTWVSPPKRCKRFRKRTTAKKQRENSQHSINQHSSPQFTFSSNSVPELRTKIYKKYLQEIESIYLEQGENMPNQMLEWNDQSESDESDQRLSRSSSSKSRWYGSNRHRIPLKRRVTSPSTNLRYKHRSFSRRSMSSRTSRHHSRRSSTSQLYTSSRFSSNSDSLPTNRTSTASSDTVHHTRSREKNSTDFGYFSNSSLPRFCGGYRLHYDESIPYFQQDSFNGPHKIDCACNKQTRVSLSENTVASSLLSFVLRSWPLVKISNFISVIKNYLTSQKGDTCYSKTTYTPTLPLPSETNTLYYGNLDKYVQRILKDAHQPACKGRHRLISKSIETDIDLDYDDTGY